ncbi:apoptosis facilitator Bcl-2-like protein 14 [Paramisgurnus dabryanus]|uniref:apoptosis facilitator Bcl-2-like protein 14 n=1 Tax=Paramisgurnus dabryanus TaxID=90735 RepID=UPI0031F34A01
MEDDSFITNSNEYRLLEVYYQKRTSKITPCVCMFSAQSATGDEGFHNVAEKLTQIVDSGLIVSEGVEADGNDDIIERLVELLKESGDELNEKIKRNHKLFEDLQRAITYSMFEKLITTFIKSVVPQTTRNREQIALTFEMTSRLRALDLQPMNRVMGFGAQYLQQHFTPWVQKHGGWEKAFEDDDDEEEGH